MSFEDIEAVFALERETAKKEAKSKRPPSTTTELYLPSSQQLTTDLSGSIEYDTAFDTLPSDDITSPTSAPDTGRRQRTEVGADAESPRVILRHKRPGRVTVPMVGNLGLLSPIHSGFTPAGHGRPPSGEIAGVILIMCMLWWIVGECMRERVRCFFVHPLFTEMASLCVHVCFCVCNYMPFICAYN